MPEEAVRTIGLSTAVLVGGLTASVLVVVGLALGPFAVDPGLDVVAEYGSWTVALGVLAAGFVQTFVTTAVHQHYGWARTPGVLLHLAWTLAFGYALVTVGVRIVPLVLCLANAFATVGLLTAGEAFDTGRTDTSEMHATDIGTGYR
ncbi:hypothetical protein [Haloarchaeobius salinus]|uniref:hypothetical protein n=1 Tax=Haloarchaeobius salinus TaxID=1198298 RepID=UPI00210C0EAD|nr:hypothetical protein [Haloarchaeobius salinus]